MTADRIGEVLAENADLTCRLITDELYSYRRPGSAFKGGHAVVTHSRGGYVRKGTDVHRNTIEAVFSLIRRGVMGTFHSVSRKHNPNYLNEFEFRWKHACWTTGQRVSKAIKVVDGNRLEYRESVDNPPCLAKLVPATSQLPAPFEGQ